MTTFKLAPGPSPTSWSDELARIDLRLGDRHLIVRGPFNTAGAGIAEVTAAPPQLWTLNEPAERPAHLGPIAPYENPEWLRELGRYPTCQQAMVAASKLAGFKLAPRRRRPPRPVLQ